MVKLLSTASSVCPSGSARATISVPTTLAAPARFSMTSGWPRPAPPGARHGQAGQGEQDAARRHGDGAAATGAVRRGGLRRHAAAVSLPVRRVAGRLGKAATGGKDGGGARRRG